jgi:hypothetical protein
LGNRRVRGIKAILIAAIVALAIAPSVLAEHFDITLIAAGPDGTTRQAFSDQDPPQGGLNPRPVLRARVGDRITIQFIMTNVYPHGTGANAGVHYFVVKERELGQKAVPALTPPTADLIVEGTFTFDLKPQARIGARQSIVISQPGNYLLRTESQRTQRDHEHFSAIDLQIQ